MICETKIYALGRFTIRQQPHFDNPAWPQFLVYLGERLLGKQFSVPSASDCEWLMAQTDAAQPSYAPRSKPARKHSTGGYNTRNATRRLAAA